MFIWLLFKVFGSIALFLFGMYHLNCGLEKAAARRLYLLIAQLTDSPLKGFLTGAFATAFLQSSSLVTVIVVGLANARSINLRQGINVIIGANVGTTITTQLLSFNSVEAALPLIGFGFLLFIITPGEKISAWGEAILGFGLLLLGLDAIVKTLTPLVISTITVNNLKSPIHPWKGIFIGLFLTAVIQSSSTVIGTVISLARYKISLAVAVAIMLGADLGTCVTALISAWGGNKPALRMAVAHFLFNLLSLFLIIPLFSYFLAIVNL
ncbi:MAG: Na/Pi cotransporter family protein, partial [Dethiobacteria bacterium]